MMQDPSMHYIKLVDLAGHTFFLGLNPRRPLGESSVHHELFTCEHPECKKWATIEKEEDRG